MRRNLKRVFAAGLTAAALMNLSAFHVYAGIEQAQVGSGENGIVDGGTTITAFSANQANVNTLGTVSANMVSGVKTPDSSAKRTVLVAGASRHSSGGIMTEGEKGYPNQEQLLGGAAITVFDSQSNSQILSCMIQTKNGSLIIVDGGLGEDAEYLRSQIIARGGHVTAWFLTHPHGDHVGALYSMMQNEDARHAAGQPADISIENIYHNFAPAEWYQANDPSESTMAASIIAILSGRPESMVHTVKKGDVIQVDDVTVQVLNDRYETQSDKGNNSGTVYKATVNGKSILFLGDMAREGGDLLLADVGSEALKSDIVQMAHHGQNGVSQSVYQAISPSVCLWPTPAWLWTSMESKYAIQTTKNWMKSLGVQVHYCTKDGDQTVR